jgi:hypothetical protein
MAEENYKIQLSTTVNGNLVNVRGQSAEELLKTVEDLAKVVDPMFTAFAAFKDGVILKDLFTGNAQTPLKSAGGGNASKPAADSDGVPSCKHGPMKDLRSKNYKSDFYCTESDRDKQCKPVKL